jgi:hypothetical protein
MVDKSGIGVMKNCEETIGNVGRWMEVLGGERMKGFARVKWFDRIFES